MSPRRTALMATVAVAAALTAAAPASARSSSKGGLQTYYTFKAVFTGSGSYTRTDSSDDGSTHGQIDASFSWTTAYANLLIPRVHEPAQMGFPAVVKGSKASGSWTISSANSDDDSCTGAGTLGRPSIAGGGVAADGGLTLKRVTGGLSLIANGLTGFSTTQGGGDGVSPCGPEDFWHDVVISGGGVGDELVGDTEPLTGISKITPSDLKKASFTKTVVPALGEVPSTDCGSGDGTTCTQAYGWTGKVTFTKTILKKKK